MSSSSTEQSSNNNSTSHLFRQKAYLIESQLINLPIDPEQFSSFKHQLPAEDYEKLLKERPVNLYLASRIKGIR
jgi:hypothetical protein